MPDKRAYDANEEVSPRDPLHRHPTAFALAWVRRREDEAEQNLGLREWLLAATGEYRVPVLDPSMRVGREGSNG
ncbi:MAG: hypothetical protein ABID40_02810 [Candidatus Bipolaricaulota bacterium]